MIKSSTRSLLTYRNFKLVLDGIIELFAKQGSKMCMLQGHQQQLVYTEKQMQCFWTAWEASLPNVRGTWPSRTNCWYSETNTENVMCKLNEWYSSWELSIVLLNHLKSKTPKYLSKKSINNKWSIQRDKCSVFGLLENQGSQMSELQGHQEQMVDTERQIHRKLCAK